MSRKINLPTLQQIEALSDAGDIDQLRAINERLAKTANQRMRQLEKTEGFGETAAYKNAKYYLYQESDFASGGVFSRSKKLTSDQLTEQIEKELIFLRSQTSTVSGERERRQKIFDSLTSEHKKEINGKKVDVPPVIDLSELSINLPSDYKGNKNDYFRDKFFSLLDENVWKDVKKYLYTPPKDYSESSGGDIFDQAVEAVARGADLSDLKELYKDYLNNEITIYDMWDKWTSV